jgi:hypothetical protein
MKAAMEAAYDSTHRDPNLYELKMPLYISICLMIRCHFDSSRYESATQVTLPLS